MAQVASAQAASQQAAVDAPGDPCQGLVLGAASLQRLQAVAGLVAAACGLAVRPGAAVRAPQTRGP